MGVARFGQCVAAGLLMAILVAGNSRAAGTDNRRDGAKILFAPVTLRPAGEVRYEIAVRALRAGDVRFRVELTADQLTAGPVHQEESTTIYTDLPASRKKSRPSVP